MPLENLVFTDKRLSSIRIGTAILGQLGETSVMVKKVPHSNKEFDEFEREVSKLKRLRHGKHIAHIYGAASKNGSLYIVMEHSRYGDLQGYLEKNKGSVTYEQKILFCRGILLGLLYCHSMGIFHGNLKCSNVILGKGLEPKLTDFDLNMATNSIESSYKPGRRSIYWAAPELFSMEEKSNFHEFKANPYPADIYSLGATFCEVSYNGTTDFIDVKISGTEFISKGFFPTPKDNFLEEIISGCCRPERKKRISLDQCLTLLDAIAEKRLPFPVIGNKWTSLLFLFSRWRHIQEDIKARSKQELPASFILYRHAEDLVVGPSNLSLLEWLCINNYKDAVEHMLFFHRAEQKHIEWLYNLSCLCEANEVNKALQKRIHKEGAIPELSDLMDNNPEQFIELLIKAGASCNEYHTVKKAVEKHYNKVVKAAIDSKIDFSEGIILDAIKVGNVEAVRILVDAGSNIEWGDLNTGDTPLLVAIDTGNIEIVKILLDSNANVHSNIYIQFGLTSGKQDRPLYIAALKGNHEIVELLIKAGANIDTESKVWQSLTQDLEHLGKQDMIGLILDAMRKFNIKTEEKSTPLCTAIQSMQPDVVKKLIKEGANIYEQDYNGYAPLHWAVVVGSEEIAKILVKSGADVDTRTPNEQWNFYSTFSPKYFNGCTPLHIAIARRKLGMVKVLIELGADFSMKDGLGRTIMEIAPDEDRKKLESIIIGRTSATVDLLGKATGSINLDTVKELTNNQKVDIGILADCFCIVACNGNKEAVNYLLERGVDINASNKYGRTSLFGCVERLQTEMVQFLVDKKADVNAGDEYGNTPIHDARNKEIAEILINAGADINAKNHHKKTPLFQCVEKSLVDMVQFLVDKGADVNARDAFENVPMHFAGSKKIVEILVGAGADVNAIGRHERTPLFQHMKKSQKNMQLMLYKEADVSVEKNDQDTLADCTESKKIVEFLISHGANVNIKDENKRTPLFRCVSESLVEMVELLVNREADVNVRDKGKNTPIHFAKSIEVIEILINAGADINAKNKYERSLLLQCVEKSQAKIVKFLADKGADVNTRDKYGNAPIHFARSIEIADILINAGADINANDMYGSTILFLCVKELQTDMVQFLIEKGADVNARDEDGNTPIHEARSREVTEILLNAGADVKAKNNNGKTVHDMLAQEQDRKLSSTKYKSKEISKLLNHLNSHK